MFPRLQRNKQPEWNQEEEHLMLSPPRLCRSQDTTTIDAIKMRHCGVTTYSPMVIHADVGKLQDIALVSLLAALIQYKNTLQIQTKRDELFVIPEMDLLKVKLPVTIKPSRVTSIAEFMKSSIRGWIRHHEKFVFFDRKHGDDCIMVYDFFNQLVWLPEGSISPKPTAKKLLDSDKLSPLEMFRLACMYCLEEDVKSLWFSLPEEIFKKECENRHPFLLYWYSVLHKKPHDDQTLFDLMKYSTKNFHYTAINYLWRKVMPKDRISKAKLICDGSNCLYMWYILCDLNDSEFNAVIEEKGLHVFEKFAKKSDFGKHLLMIWNRIADKIEIDSFEDIFKVVVHYYEMDIGTRNNLRWELWRRAPEHLKNKAASRNPDNYLSTPYNFPLIVDVISRVDFQYRVEHWRRNWHRFLIEPCCETSIFEKIMHLRFQNEREILAFKNEEMIDYEEMKISVRMLVEKWSLRQNSEEISPFAQLQKFLNTCSSDPKVILDLKQKIITRTSTDNLLKCIFKFVDPRIVKEFDVFLVDAFTTNIALQKFKAEFISSPRCIEIIKCQFPIRLDRLSHIMKLVDTFSPCESELTEMKKSLVEITHRFIIKGTIVAEEINSKKIIWKDFIIWCFDGDQDQIKQFKKSIPIDKVFKLAFRKILGTLAWYDIFKYPDPDPTALSHARRNYIFGDWMKNFAALDSFIDWFFESEEDAWQFRLKVTVACDSDFAKQVFGDEWRMMFPNYLNRISYILKLWCQISILNRFGIVEIKF